MSDGSGRGSWFPRVATALAILACYGTTALIGLLSLLGVSLAVNEGIWAGAIGVFAALAMIAIAVSYRRHRIVGPALVAALGLGLILWVMFGSYSRVIELSGFVLLIAATLWDWRVGARTSATVDAVSWIEPGTLAERLGRDPKPVIVDVRGVDEFNGPLGHIANALNLPVGEFPNRMMEINALKEKPVVLVCRTQMRSANAAVLLSNAGFRDTRVLQGGMERWNQNGLPVEGRTAASNVRES
jgi:rhodanese-related sulfurtransferase